MEVWAPSILQEHVLAVDTSAALRPRTVITP
jgi:hypothetical protein